MRILSIRFRLTNGRGNWKLRANPRWVRWWAARPSTVRPSKRTVPASLCSVPQMQLTSVLLPEPFGPISPSRSPGATESEMFSSATKPPKRLLRLSTSSRRPVTVMVRSQSWHGPRRVGFDMTAADKIFRLALPIVMDEPDDSVRRQDHEGYQNDADHQQIDGGRDGDGDDLLQRAEQDGADQRADPARGAADQRHGDRVDGVVQPERGRWLQVADVVREWRPGHAHQRAGDRGRDQFEPQRRHAGGLGRQLIVANGGKA